MTITNEINKAEIRPLQNEKEVDTYIDFFNRLLLRCFGFGVKQPRVCQKLSE